MAIAATLAIAATPPLQAVLGRELFCEAWFQLCDLWTDAICEGFCSW
jgi:hypothetical protein